MDSTAAAASRQVDERNSTPDECAREMSSNRCPNRQSGQVEPLLAVRKACTVAPPILPIRLELETNHCPMELVLDADKYEEFQRDPYAYLGVDAAEVELDAKVCKGEQFSSLAEEPPIAAAVDVCDGKDDLGKRNRSSPSESGIRQTTMATPSSSSHYQYVARKVFRLPTELKEIVCNLLLDKCRPIGHACFGRLSRRAQSILAFRTREADSTEPKPMPPWLMR
jgi:hypothetical protein